MKPPSYPLTGDMPDCPPDLDGTLDQDTRPAERRAWQTPRLYHLDVGADTEFQAVGFKIDGNFFLS